MTTTRLTSLQEAARHLLDQIERGQPVRLEISARDAETGALHLLLLEVHRAALQRQVGVQLSTIAPDSIQLQIAGDG